MSYNSLKRDLPSRRVVVTGRGVISPLGDTPAVIHQALCEGRRSIAQIEGFDVGGLLTREAAEVDFDPKKYLGGRNLRPIDRTGRLVIAAAHLALEDSGWDDEMRRCHEAGLALGTMFGSVHTISAFDRRALEAGPKYVKPFDFANSVINAAAGQTAIWHGLRGINSTITGGITAGLQALSYATEMIRSGRAHAILAGGGEELCFESMLGFCRARRLAEDSTGAVPFSTQRQGMALGEGAALLMLEEANFARKRGARIVAEICGHGTSFDPSRGTNQEKSVGSLSRAIQQAFEDAGCGPADISCVSAGANGSPTGDLRESMALTSTFSNGGPPPITAIKGALGESLGASASLQTVTLVEALRQGLLPGIADLEPTGSDVSALNLSSAPRSLQNSEKAVGLISCQGLDGQAAALVVKSAIAKSQG